MLAELSLSSRDIQPDEVTADMLARSQGIPRRTAAEHLHAAERAGKLTSRLVVIDGHCRRMWRRV